MGDYYQVTNLWLLLYYREFRRLKITVLHLFGKKCDRTSHNVHPNSREFDWTGTADTRPPAPPRPYSPAMQPCGWRRPTVALEQVELCCSHPDSWWSSKAAVCFNGSCSPAESYASHSEQRQDLCIWSRGAEDIVASPGLLRMLWARILFPSPAFPPGASLLPEMQVRVEFPPGKCLAQSPLPQQSLALSLHLYFITRHHPSS